MTTYRQLPLSRLGHLIPPLVEGQSLVALVPLTDDLAWAGKAAWDIARIAARDGRRVALVDLHLEKPALHEVVGLQPSEGIVDAFEYGVSLNKAAHEVTGVFLIPAGSDTASAPEVITHPRWPKLHAGFRSEGALLLVFVSNAGLASLSATPDGAIILAPEGLPSGFTLDRAIPLLGVARDRWLPAAHPIPKPDTIIAPSPRRGVWIALAALLIAGLAVGGWVLLAGARESFVAPPAPPVAATQPQPAPLPAPPPARPLDTLGWTVQLAAYASLPKALSHADQLAKQRLPGAFVTPVPQTAGGPLWYRVLAGSYASRAMAANARAEYWRRGIASRGIGDLVRAPYTFRIAGVSVDSLRSRRFPAVRWNDSVTVGAFESPEQAARMKAALARAGVRATLLPRMGTP